MAAPQLTIGPAIKGEYIGLRAAMEQFPGLAYSSLRAYIKSGRLKAFRAPSGKLWVRPTDVAALFQPVTPTPTQED
jgi:hypothetical protein